MTTAVRLAIEPDTLSKLEAWHESIRTKAIQVIQKTLPEKVLTLNQKILQTEEDKNSLFSKHHYYHPEKLGTDTTVYHSLEEDVSAVNHPSKKRKTSTNETKSNGVPDDQDSHVFNGIVKASDYFEKVFDELRQEWDEMIHLMDSLKMYINIQIPLIEDGDTFGVSVQEEALNEIIRTQDNAYNLLNTLYNYSFARAEIASKMVRYPGVEDYARALREHDRKTIYKAHMQWSDTRNMYVVVLDILRKNITKISKPKSGNQMGSYG